MLVGEVFARMGLDSKQYEKGLNKLEGYTQKRALTLGTIFKNAFSFGIGIGLVQGFRSLGDAITDFVNTAARTEVLDIAMQSVARSSGYAIAALNEQRKAVMELGIAEQEASQILTRFMQAQLDTADAAKLARVAQDAAVISGMNSSQAAEQMTEAIAKQRPELLSAFGMTRNMNEIYKDYAGTVGKTAAQLSEAEKKQAMLNYILKEGEKIAGTYEASMGAVGKQIGSLPRYWDTLKNAIAKPLALPAISVIVDGITNSLKNAIAWAEANQSTLQRWGQTAANVATVVIRGFRWVTKILIENWRVIRFAATAFLTFAVASKAVSYAGVAVRGLTLLLWALRGHAFSTTGAFGILATSVRTYQAASIGAAGATGIFTRALATLRGALYAVNAALGPVGWILIGLSLLVAGGLHLWNKYTQSLQKTPKLSNKIEDSTAAVNKKIRDQAEALKAAGKAAAKNLQPFDEINQLQKEMGGLGDMPELDMPGLDIPELGLPDMGDMLAGFGAGLEEVKGTFKGFLQWIWGYVTDWFKDWNWWEILLLCLGPAFQIGLLIYKNWDKIVTWVKETLGPLFAPIGEAWGRFVAWAGNLWDTIKIKWNNFKDWVREKWNAFWDPIKQKWNNFKTWAGNLWDSVKIKWDNFKTNIQQKWNAFWEPIKTRWNSFKSWAGELLAPVRQKWNSFVTWARGIWDGLLKKWNEIKSWPLWKWISDKVNWLKNVFNFKWSLPKIKLPRFTVSWSTAGLWGSIGKFLGLPGKPVIDVTWLAKGGILTRPTLFGGGEAGREAVLPLDNNTGWADIVADRLAAALQKTQLAGAGAGGAGDIYVYIGNEQVDAYIYRSQDRRNVRSNGR
jgi:hypothetical protein